MQLDMNTILTFGIPAAIVLRIAWPHLMRLFRIPQTQTNSTQAAISAAGYQPPPAPKAPRKSAQQATGHVETLPTASATQWLAYVNNSPNTVPHVAIVGPSGAGKTTLARAILGQRSGQILVITAKEGDDWGGLPYVGIDDDGSYTTAQRTFEALDKEVKRRLLAMKHHEHVGEWLTVVLDDYSTLRAVCPAADAPFKIVARIGRALGVRLMVLSDTASVKAWGIEGQGETRGNFAFLFVKRGHKVTTTYDDVDYILDTSDVPRLAQVVLAARAWNVPIEAKKPQPAQMLMVKDLEMIPAAVVNAENNFPAVESDFTTSNLPFSTAEIARIAASIGAGNGKTDVITSMPRYSGRKHREYTAYYESINAMLADV